MGKRWQALSPVLVATAHHEAGHAVVGRALSLPCGSATIAPDHDSAGQHVVAPPDMLQAHWDARGRWIEEAAIMRARAITFMAGAETEVELFGKCQGGDGDDRLQAALMVETFADEDDALRWEARLRRHTRRLVRHHLDRIVRVGVDLLARGTLTGENIDALYPHDVVSMMGALARDAEVGAKWRTETAIKGGSDSVANLFATMGGKAGDVVKHVSLGMVAVEAITRGFEHGGVKGAAVGGAGAATAYLVNTLRSAGIRRVGDLYRDALADPELARSLISKMPASDNAGALHALARTLKRNLIVGPMVERQALGPAGPYAPPPSVPAPTPSRITVPHDHPILTKGRRAPDGFTYVPDPRTQGRFMRIGP